MQFSRLRLQGFKSFVDATEFFIEPGLTGVVGPNGCGKSNLVEAIRWVMGEISAKQMRGGEMDDMIFGGSDARPPRNLAEVALVLDNSDRTAPAMFNDAEEIEVIRRIERGSGSVYRVNGREVRARDVQLLFADAATGARSTALVSQGRIGAIISARPAERRHLLEEAAGITGLHSRRHEAELRLHAADTNLERLDDILAALDEQLRGLKRQARQAARYRNLSDHIRNAEAALLYWRQSEAAADLETARAHFGEAENTVADLTREAGVAATRQTDIEASLPEIRQGEAEAAAALQRSLLARDSLDSEEARLVAERQTLDERLAQIARDIEREKALGQDAAGAILRIVKESATLNEAQAAAEDARRAASEGLQAASEAAGALEDAHRALTAKVATDEARQAAFEHRIAEIEARQERLVQRRAKLAAQRDQAEGEAAEAGAGALEESRSNLAGLRGRLEEARGGREQAEQTYEAALAAQNEARAAAHDAEAEHARLTAEESALTELLAIGNPELWPPLIDKVTVGAGYEMALGAALGDDLNAAADEAAPVHWSTLPPPENAPSLPEGAELLSNFVTGPAALTGRLSQIGVVADQKTGDSLRPRLAYGQRLVGRDGALWRWDGFTARAGAPTAATTRLAQANRLKETKVHLAAAADPTEAAGKLLARAITKTEGDLANTAAARREASEAETEFHKARDEEATLAAEIAGAASRRASISESLDGIDADIAEAEAAAQAARQELASLGSLAAKREAADEKRSELGRARESLAECQGVHDRLDRESWARQQRLVGIAGEIDAWQGRVDGATQQLDELRVRGEAAMVEADRMAARPAEIATQRQGLMDRIDGAEEKRKQAANVLAVAESDLADATRDMRARGTALSEAREERVRRDAAREQAAKALADVAERIRERLSCEPEEVLSSVGIEDDGNLPDHEAVETKLERLLRERDNMGPVNLRAEAEAAELDEKIATMQAERADLMAAIARLRQAIAGLNRDGRQRLLTAFDEVNKHLGELFVRLFGGGRAHLKLVDAEDPLEAGIEILASPPGKKLQVMSLLSGGEQALTALSLLFAVFLTNPAPICVLDEVDAPLDDANVDRFCTMLERLAHSLATRFLLVTHHRLTMARMDRLFGVTMGEQGVSQLVSVDLQAAERLRQTA